MDHKNLLPRLMNGANQSVHTYHIIPYQSPVMQGISSPLIGGHFTGTDEKHYELLCLALPDLPFHAYAPRRSEGRRGSFINLKNSPKQID